MAMNIKNPEAERLTKELASITGESLTAAITAAVRERLKRVRLEHGAGLAERLIAIGEDCASRLKDPFRYAEHGDLLYDDHGLPR